MLVYSIKDLPKDPVFPADLEKLGYFITDKDQIRKISDPTQEFQFKISSHERWNELHREAVNTCIRRTVLSRLHDLGLSTLRLPVGAGPNEQHVPILVSSNLSTAKRIVVVFGEPIQDLGIWAYRSLGSESISTGSAIAFAKAVLYGNKGQDGERVSEEGELQADIALVLANTGQRIWHCGSATAMTQPTWLALPRKYAVEPPMQMTRRNKIPRNSNWQEHVECVFEDVLAARGRMVREDAKIDIIGVAEGGLGAVRYLANNWEKWSEYISGMCLANPLHRKDIDISPDMMSLEDVSAPDDSSFAEFMSSRCRAYLQSDKPVNYGVPGTLEYGCNCYSSGEELHAECVIVSAWMSMLAWLDKLYADPTYREVEVIVEEDFNDGGWEQWRKQEETAENEEATNSGNETSH